jgi:hypothetical protein
VDVGAGEGFPMMVNRSVTLELHEIQETDFDLSLTGFDPGEIDKLLVLEDEEKPTPLRRFRMCRLVSRGTFGFWGRTGSYAATAPTPTLSRSFLATARRA